MLPALQTNGSLLPAVAGPVNRLSSLFDRFFNDDFFAPLTAPSAWSRLPLSCWEDDQYVHVEMDTPGMAEKDLELAVHEDRLIIRGERKFERKEGGYDTRSYGQFEQQVGLPAAVDADQVEARLSNGVLHVALPKKPEARPRRIAIKSE